MERAVALMHGSTRSWSSDLPEKVRDYKAGRLVFAASDPSELITAAGARTAIHSPRAHARRRQQVTRRSHPGLHDAGGRSIERQNAPVTRCR